MPHDDRDPLSDTEVAAMFADATWAERFPPILTIDDAAELLRTPAETLRDWRSRGLLNGCVAKPGKHLLFLRDRLIKRIFAEWKEYRDGR